MRTLKYSRGKVSTADHNDRPFGVFATVQRLSNHLGVFFGNILKYNCISPDLTTIEHVEWSNVDQGIQGNTSCASTHAFQQA